MRGRGEGGVEYNRKKLALDDLCENSLFKPFAYYPRVSLLNWFFVHFLFLIGTADSAQREMLSLFDFHVEYAEQRLTFSLLHHKRIHDEEKW